MKKSTKKSTKKMSKNGRQKKENITEIIKTTTQWGAREARAPLGRRRRRRLVVFIISVRFSFFAGHFLLTF